jgi:hypothetical protein
MSSVSRVEQLHQQCLTIREERKSIFTEVNARIKEIKDFPALLDLVIRLETAADPFFRDLSLATETFQLEAEKALVSTDISYGRVVEMYTGLREYYDHSTIQTAAEVYNQVATLTKAKACQLLNAHLALKKTSPAEQSCADRAVQEEEAMLAELITYVSEEDLSPEAIEIKGRLQGQKRERRSPFQTRCEKGYGDAKAIQKDLVDYKKQATEKNDLIVKLLELSTRIEMAPLKKASQPEMTQLGEEFKAVNQKLTLLGRQVEPLHVMLIRHQEVLLEADRKSSEDVRRFLHVARYLKVLFSIHQTACQHNLAREGYGACYLVVRLLIELPSKLRIQPAEEDKGKVLALLENTEQNTRHYEKLGYRGDPQITNEIRDLIGYLQAPKPQEK